MRLHGAGQAILYYRDYYSVSQAQVCEGICSIATLSRVEMDTREVDSLLSETLIGRLGKSSNRFEFVLNDLDYYLYELRYNIEKAYEDEKFEELKGLLSRYEKNFPKSQILHRQFLAYYKTKYLEAMGESEEVVMENLWKVINMTRPDFMEKRKEQMLFSPIEVKVIYDLFRYERFEEEKLTNVFHFAEVYYAQEEKEKVLIPFLYQMAMDLEKNQKYQDVIRVVDQAIHIVSEGRRYLQIEDFYFLRIKMAEKVYHSSEQWEEKRLQLIEECQNVYYAYMLDDKLEEMQEVVLFCEERLSCQIIEPEI